jgi:hypothetical protein
MPNFCHTTRAAVCFGFLTVCVLVACRQSPGPSPTFRVDLRPYGFVTEKAPGEIAASFTDLNFLSNDLVLATVNNRVFGPVERADSDEPPSKLLQFEISGKRLLKNLDTPVEKHSDSVKAVQDGRFAMLNESGLRLCSHDFECGPPLPTHGPLLVSPAGTRIVVGGDGQTEQRLLDGATLTELARFPPHNSVVPCDGALLFIRKDHTVYVRPLGKPDRVLPFRDADFYPEVRCINQNSVAGFESDKALAVANMNGTVLFRVAVQARWEMPDVLASASGNRFCFHEKGYTAWNSFVNFLDIDHGRPVNFESISVMSTDSGAQVFELRWDPRPYMGTPVTPVLSPDGHKVAVIRHGILEVYQVP